MAFLLTVRSPACRIAVSKRLSWKYRLASCLKSDASGARTVERIRFYPSPRNLVPICHRPRRGTRRCRWHLTTFVFALVFYRRMFSSSREIKILPVSCFPCRKNLRFPWRLYRRRFCCLYFHHRSSRTPFLMLIVFLFSRAWISSRAREDDDAETLLIRDYQAARINKIFSDDDLRL